MFVITYESFLFLCKRLQTFIYFHIQQLQNNIIIQSESLHRLLREVSGSLAA